MIPTGRASSPAYVISARRSALGRVGGIHRARNLEQLSAPVIAAVLRDAGVDAAEVEGLVLGNTSAGGNPARAVAIAAELPAASSALTVDRHAASGLDAILIAAARVRLGEASLVLAGGAECLSTAPWRLLRPRTARHMPRFAPLEPMADGDAGVPQAIEAAEALALRLGITRDRQDAWALKSHLKAVASWERRMLLTEIVALRATAEEARDESAIEPSLADLKRLSVLLPPDGTLTTGNSSAPHDGAAFVLVASQAVWERLGRPPAMTLSATAEFGADGDDEAIAPARAVQRLWSGSEPPADLAGIEICETSAAQAIALAVETGVDVDLINSTGGGVVRGHPAGAAGAVAVVRVFTRLVRHPSSNVRAVAVQGAAGGLAVAAEYVSAQ